MPQPLPVNLQAQIKVGEAALKRPVLAILGADVFARWAQLEATLSVVFHSMLMGDPRPTAAMFHLFKGKGLQYEGIEKLGQLVLEEESRLILAVLLKLCRSAAKNRDTLAHHMWGLHDDIPDGLILINPRDFAAIQTETKLLFHKDDLQVPEAQKVIDLTRASLRVWKRSDFEFAAKAISRVTILLTTFSIMVPSKTRQTIDQNARTILLRDPDIKAYVDKHDAS